MAGPPPELPPSNVRGSDQDDQEEQQDRRPDDPELGQRQDRRVQREGPSRVEEPRSGAEPPVFVPGLQRPGVGLAARGVGAVITTAAVDDLLGCFDPLGEESGVVADHGEEAGHRVGQRPDAPSDDHGGSEDAYPVAGLGPDDAEEGRTHSEEASGAGAEHHGGDRYRCQHPGWPPWSGRDLGDGEGEAEAGQGATAEDDPADRQGGDSSAAEPVGGEADG